MEIYVSKDGAQAGPFPMEEIQKMLAAGQYSSTDHGWHDGLPDWVPLLSILPTKTTSGPPPPPPKQPQEAAPLKRNFKLTADDYRVEGEHKTKWWGFGILIGALLILTLFWDQTIIILALIAVIGTGIYVWINQSQFLGGCAAISSKQFPEIFKIAKEAAERLHMKQPEMFIKHSPEINASAIGFLGRKSVVLHSATIEAMDDDELMQIIGHEFSHIKCGHTNILVLTNGHTSFSVPVISQALRLVFLLYSRKAEYTCDRGGLLACRNLKAAISAMCKVAVGPELFKRMDIESFMNQNLAIDQNDVAKLSESLADHPYTVRRIRALTNFYESPIYKQLTFGT